MEETCKQCGNQFEVLKEDMEFYRRISPKFGGQTFEMPAPSLCFSCRHQKRLAFRNEMALYHRKCDKTGKQMISMYRPESPYRIYDQEVWWGDSWDPLEYGRDFDFKRPFFEQFKELQMEVPRMSLNNIKAENSEYCNYAFSNKNSYLAFTADFNESSSYLRFSDRNFRCLDCDYTYDSTDCYDCLEVKKCNGCFYSYKAENCSGLIFCYNMMSCHDCICCANLNNKRYCIFNEQYSREEYLRRKDGMKICTHSGIKNLEKDFRDFLLKQPRKYNDVINCENCFGDHLRNCKNAIQCYNCMELEDCRYMINCYYAKDCYDWDFVGLQGSSLCHEMVSSALNMVNCHFCANCWEGDCEIFYCELCLHAKNLFGCIALRHKQYCILNKQYTKEQYEELVPKIISHMQKTGEWGEFFPMTASPFAYNESAASEYFSLNKEDVLAKGWQWYEDEGEKMYKGPKYEIPDNIGDVGDDILRAVLTCGETGKPYKIIATELAFLKKIGLPAPRISPKQRYKNRAAMRNPFVLYERKCGKCGAKIFTSYAPERLEPVYCEECYLKEVF